MFKRKLFKRALPIILSVAMIFQSMPATAMAAESSQAVVSETENETDADNADGSNDDSSGEKPDGEPNDDAAEEPGSDAKSPADETGNSGTESGTGTTETETGTESIETGSESDTGKTETKTETETEAVEIKVDAEKDALEAAKIVIDNRIGDWGEELNLFTRVLNATDLTFYTSYVDPLNTSKYGDFQRGLLDYIQIYVGDEEVWNLEDKLTYTWQVKNPDTGEYTDILAPKYFPTDVDSYRLKISLNAVEGVCSAAEDFYVYVDVEKAEIDLVLDEEDCLTIEPGRSVQELIDRINENYVLRHTDRNRTTVSRDILESEDKKLPLTVYKVEKGTRTALAATDVFSANADYVVTVGGIVLTDNAAKNYEVSMDESYRVVVGALRETEVVYTLENPGKDIILKYSEGKELKIDELIKDGTIAFAKEESSVEGEAPKVVGEPKVVTTDDKEDVTGAVVEPGWYTRKNTDNDIPSEGYELMTGNPKDAGEYYIIWRYAGDEGKAYTASESKPLRVTIDPVSVVITADAKDLKLYEGMDSSDVTRELAKLAYSVCPVAIDENGNTTVGEDGKLKLDAALAASIVKEDFFGVSYAGDDTTDREQYYKPVFELQRCVAAIRDEEGNVTTVDEKDYVWNAYRNTIVIRDEGEKGAYTEYKYRIRFTGDKAVYNGTGNQVRQPISVTDTTTNSANKNYLADITAKTLDDYAVVVEPTAAKATTIKVDEIVKTFTDAYANALNPEITPQGDGTLDKPAVKIYDTEALFKNRGEYKKAVVNGEDKDNISSNTDEKISYRWQYISLDTYYEEYASKSTEEKKYVNIDALFNNNEFIGSTDSDDGSYDSCINAGVYRLTVSYNDPAHEYRSSVEYAYFMVEQQEIIIVPNKQFVRKDGYVFANRSLSQNDYTIYKYPKNDTAEDKQQIDTSDLVGDRTGLVGDLTGEVKRQEKDPNGNLTDKYISIPESELNNPWDESYKYGIFAYCSVNTNYTTIIKNIERSTGEVVHHEEEPGEICFYAGEIYPEIDEAAIAALSKTYDGKPVTIPEGAIKLYSDRERTTEISAETLSLNTTESYDPAKVNVLWDKIAYDADGNEYLESSYETNEAIFGGTYYLRLRYEGSEEYAPLNNRYASWDGYYYGPSFEIRQRDITIKPKLKEAAYVTAGDYAGSLLVEAIDFQKEDTATNQGVLKQDEGYFTYTEMERGTFGKIWRGYNTVRGENIYDDLRYIVDNNGGYPAFDDNNSGDAIASYIIQVDGRDIKEPWNELLRNNRKYTVKLTRGLASPLDVSYNVIYGTEDITVTNKGMADITGTAFGNDDDDGLGSLLDLDIVYDYANSTYTVKSQGAVRFAYDQAVLDGITVTEQDEFDGEAKNKNWLAFRIYAPKEFEETKNAREAVFAANSANFIFENSIKAAGGYIIGTRSNLWTREDDEDDEVRHFITVLFPLTAEDKDKKEFNITWENGYTDTFKFADLVLEADLRKAVAPKSIKFNGVSAKMAVGETQQLDVKITKAQLGDVVSIRYRIKGGVTKNDNISIDPETGVVTALRAGKTATVVEAYPVYIGADGKAVPVKDSKGKEAKAATAKITVTDVTAPVIKKIEAQDVSATVWYSEKVRDGYRREIYLVDATADASKKKWKEKDFEEAISKVKNGQYAANGFVRGPIYDYSWERIGDAERDANLLRQIFTGLATGNTYVVYIRNVSAARTLDDGSVVDLSHKGVVKSFVTTKSQVQRLDAYFDAKVTSDEDAKKSTDKKNPVYVTSEGSRNYNVLLSAKSAQLKVDGLFIEREDGNKAAEDNNNIRDLRRYALQPMSKTDRAKLSKYLIPKLTYGVFDVNDINSVENWRQATPSRYATINNKGKITLKGVGENGQARVYVYVMSDNNRISAPVTLNIKAYAAAMTGRKVKMKVGQTISLADYLEYKDASKKKIPNYYSSNVMITDKMIADAAKAGYRISDDRENFNDNIPDNMEHIWKITAVSPNKSFKLEVTDKDAEGKAMTATVTLSSTQLDSVKGLKVTYVDNRFITINFTHSARPEDENWDNPRYVIEVKDARGSVVETRVIGEPEVIRRNRYSAAVVKNMQQWIQEGFGNWNEFKYYAATGTYAYTFGSEKLVRLSAYTISVTPVYGNQKAAKTVTTKTKTTNIPASYYNLDVPNIGAFGGTDIELTTGKYNEDGISEDYNWITLNRTPYHFVSGNTYTLKVNDGEIEVGAKDRVTDTLTWKSSNTKVASIKANPGTYTATFKALGVGTTTISVTSKITKKVIARYAVKVKAVGNGSGYHGDYEPTWDEFFYREVLALYDPFYEGRLEVLTESVPLTFVAGDGYDRRWVSFTAPSFGAYTFTKTGDSGFDTTTCEFYDSTRGSLNIRGNNCTLYLEAGQKIYIKVPGGSATLSVTGEEFARLTTANNSAQTALEVARAGWVSFTAPEDNYYTFRDAGNNVSFTTVRRNNDRLELVDGSIGLKAGDTLFIQVTRAARMYVEYRTSTTLELKDKTKSVTLNKDNKEQYISFKAPITGEYVFSYKDKSADYPVDVTFYDALGNGMSTNVLTDEETTDVERTFRLKAGETIIIRLSISDTETREFNASITVREIDEKQTLTKEVEIAAGNTEFVKFVVTEINRYTYSITNGSIEGLYSADYEPIDSNVSVQNGKYTLTVKDNNGSVKAGDTILIKVEANAATEGNTDKTVLSVTKASVNKLVANATADLTMSNNSDDWYTFTAETAGTYVFNLTVDQNKENNEDAPTHMARIYEYEELFGNGNGTSRNMSFMRSMKPGQSVVLNPRVFNKTAYADTLTSKAHISVTLVDVKSWAVGESVSVVNNEKASEAYYIFTAKDTDNYTLTWKATNEETNPDKPIVSIGDSVISTIGVTIPAAGYELGNLKAGVQKIIKVETEDGKKVNGTLTITSDESGIVEVKDGKLDFDLKAGESKTFKFTASEASKYDFVTTLTDKKEVDEYPTIDTDKGYFLDTPFATDWLDKAETIKITVKAPAGNASKGNVTIKPVSEVELTKDETVEVTNTTYARFKYVIPATGRYEFNNTFDAEKADVQTSAEKAKMDNVENGTYLKKGEVLSIEASGFDAAKQTVKIAMPKLVTPETLSKGETSVIIPANGYKYYEFTADADTAFSFTKTAVEGKNDIADIKLYRNSGDDDYYNTRIYLTQNLDLKSGDKLFIRMTASEAAEFKYTVKANNVIKVGSSELTIKANETENLRLNVYEPGIYTFNITGLDDKAQLSYNYGESKSSIYAYVTLTGKQYDFTVRNNAAADAKVTIKVTKIEPKKAEASKGENGVDVNEVAPGENAFFELAVHKAGRYTVRITAADGANLSTDLSAKLGADVITGSGTNSIWLMKNYPDELIESEITPFTVTNNGASKADIKVVVTEVKPTALKLDEKTPITVKKNESQWVSFVPDEDNRYTFAIDSDKVTVKQETNGGLLNVNGDAVMYKGKTYTYRITYTPAADEQNPAAEVTANVTISTVKATEIKATTPVEIANGNEVKWFRFTADKEAFYTFVLKKGDDAVSGRIEYTKDITGNPRNNFSGKYFDAAEKGYIRVSELEKGSYTLEITAIEPFYSHEFTTYNEQTKVDFTVPKSGIYRATAISTNSSSFRVSSSKGFGDMQLYDSSRESSLLMEGDTVTFTVTSRSDDKQKIALFIEEENVATAITAGDAAQTGTIVQSGKVVYYDFAVTSDGRYAFTGTGTGYSFTYKVVSAEGSDTSFSSTEYLDLKNGNRVLLTVRKTSSVSSQYTLKVEEVKAVSVDNTTQENPLELTAPVDTYYGFTAQKAYITFKAPKDGKYYIAAKAADENVSVRLEDNTRASYDSEGAECDLLKDQTVNLIVTNNSYQEAKPAEVQFKLIVKEVATDTKMTAGTPVSGTLDKNENAYYVFEASEKANYIVYLTNGFDFAVMNDDGTERNLYYGEIQLDTKETIKVSPSSDNEGGSYKLTIKKIVSTPISLGTTSGKAELGEYAYYEFEAPEDGDYVAFVGYDFDVQYKTANMSYWSYINSATISLNAKDKVDLRVRNSSSSEGNFEFTVKKHTVDEITVGVPQSGTLLPREYAYYEFTVSESGNYIIFESEGLSVSYKKNDSSSWDWRLEAFFEAGDKVMLSVYDNSSVRKDFKLTVKKLITETIRENETKTGTLASGEYVYYEFEASKSDYYTIRMTNVQLQYKVGESDYWNSIDGTSGTMSIKYPLDEGQMLILRVRSCDSDSNYEVTIKRDVVNINTIELDNPVTETLEAGEFGYYRFTGFGCYTVSLNGGNLSSYYILRSSDDSDINFDGASYMNTWNKTVYLGDEGEESSIYLRVQNIGSEPTKMTLNIGAVKTVELQLGSEEVVNLETYGQTKYFIVKDTGTDYSRYNITGLGDGIGDFWVEQVGYNYTESKRMNVYGSQGEGNNPQTMTVEPDQGCDEDDNDYNYIIFKVYAYYGGEHDMDESYNHSITISVTRYDDTEE